jgi:hypothetical protein
MPNQQRKLEAKLGKVYDVNTPLGTFERAQAEGLGVSLNFIRKACADGRLKHTKAGTKHLIYYPNLIKLLENGDDADGGNEIPRQPERYR